MRTIQKKNPMFHPVRVRILGTLAGGKKATPYQIGQRLFDVPQATLYRQINQLIKANILLVHELIPNRGTLEKVLMINPNSVEMESTELQKLSRSEFSQESNAFLAKLIAEFDRYQNSPYSDFKNDGLSLQQTSLWLSENETNELLLRLRAAIAPFLENSKSAERRQRTLSTLLIPEPQVDPKKLKLT